MNCGVVVNRIKSEFDQLEEGYIDGYFFGDGYAHYNKKDRHYRTEFFPNSERDKDIRAKIEGLLAKAGLKFSGKKDKRSNSWRIRVDSKEFYFKMVNKNQKFESLQDKDPDYQTGFLSGFIDAESYVVKGDITITQENKAVLDKITQICGILHIPTGKMWSFQSKKMPNKAWRLRILTKIKHYNHISCKINRIYAGSGPTP